MKDVFQERSLTAAMTKNRFGVVAPLATPLAQSGRLPRAEVLGAPLGSVANIARAPRRRRQMPALGWYGRIGKRALDLALVAISLPVVLPVILLCALALWIESGQPFYRQKRLGEDGRVFRLLKLRTMVRDADRMLDRLLATNPALRAEWDATQKLKHDPRITRVGAILRATSLDELPQLWNVIKGEMSLVGPRPMMVDQLPLYGDPFAYFAVKPGITGLWQVSTRNENRFDYRCKVDAAYLKQLSLWADLVLIVRTLGVVVRRTGY